MRLTRLALNAAGVLLLAADVACAQNPAPRPAPPPPLPAPAPPPPPAPASAPADAALTYTSGMWRLSGYFPNVSYSQLLVLAKRAEDLSTALPQSNDSMTPIDVGTQWKSFAGSTASIVTSDVREMIQILQAPARLDDGTIVVQEFNPGVGLITSAAACTSGGVRILYDPYAIAALLPPGLRFLKAHELAHVALQHIKCDRQPNLLPNYRERDADCRAVRKLEAAGPSGHDAVTAAAAFFQTQNDPAQGPYESSRDRASYIYHRCS